MAAPPGSVGNVEGEFQNQNSYPFIVNGEDKETAILSGDESVDSLPSLESMLQAATDLQGESPDPRRIKGRLEVELADPAASNYHQYHSSGASSLVNPSSTSKGLFAPTQGQHPSESVTMTESGGYSYSVPQSNPNAPAGQGSNQILVRADTSAKVEALKKWTMSTYKYTRQIVNEKLGRRTKTVDEGLEKHIEGLRETQKKYAALLKLIRQLTHQFHTLVLTQRSLNECFTDLSMKDRELQDEFGQNAELQKTLTKNGETLLNAMGFFAANLSTLCTKTIEDTIMTIKQYESIRIEYDAYRTDLEAYDAVGTPAREDARKVFVEQKGKFEKVKEDLNIKLKFLEENKVKVMRKQLLLFHNAVAAYFSGNKKELDNIMKEFHVKVSNKGEGSSFLEH